jgi:hypothetical protein
VSCMRFRRSLNPLSLALVLTAVLTLLSPGIALPMPALRVNAQEEAVVVVNASGTYLKIPIIESNMTFAGVTFFAYMYNQTLLVISFASAVNANIDVKVYDLNMNLLASASYQVSAGRSANHSLALPKPVNYAVVSLTVNGYQAPLFVVRYMPTAQQLPLAGYGGYQLLVAMISGLMVVAPVLGLILRGTPRAGALMLMTLSWALLAVMTYFASAVGTDMRLVYAVLGVAFAYAVLAFAVYRKG